MEYCDQCQRLMNLVLSLEDEVGVLRSKLDISQTQVKVLREESVLLRQKVKVSKPQPNKKRPTQELKECYDKIEQLQEIIKHKDAIIREQSNHQVPYDNFSETSEDLTKESLHRSKKIKM